MNLASHVAICWSYTRRNVAGIKRRLTWSSVSDPRSSREYRRQGQGVKCCSRQAAVTARAMLAHSWWTERQQSLIWNDSRCGERIAIMQIAYGWRKVCSKLFTSRRDVNSSASIKCNKINPPNTIKRTLTQQPRSEPTQLGRKSWVHSGLRCWISGP